MTARKPRNTSHSRRFGPLDVGLVNEEAMTTARQLARQHGGELRVVDQQTVAVENTRPTNNPWSR